MAKFIKISIFVNPVFVVLETVAVKISSIFIFPILIAFITLIVTVIVFVSGYAFTRGLGRAYNGDYIRNVRKIIFLFFLGSDKYCDYMLLLLCESDLRLA